MATLAISTASFSQLEVNTNFTDEELLEWIEGAAIEVSNLTVDCGTESMGLFTNPDLDNGLEIVDGILLSTGLAIDAIGPNDGTDTGMGSGITDDEDLAMTIVETGLNDVCRIEFDAVPEFDHIIFSYVFGSEEYEEWVGSPFNDVFGFFISGPGIEGEFTNDAENYSKIPGTDLPVSVNNVNQDLNSEFYIFNGSGNSDTEPYYSDPIYCRFDGLTVNLPGLIEVVPDETYHFKIVIADVSDSALNSGIFLQRQSIMSVTFVDVPMIEKSSLSVFPNPFEDIIQFDIENSNQISSLEVLNIEGRIVKMKDNMQDMSKVDLSELESGAYVLRVKMNNGEIITKNMIKN